MAMFRARLPWFCGTAALPTDLEFGAGGVVDVGDLGPVGAQATGGSAGRRVKLSVKVGKANR